MKLSIAGFELLSVERIVVNFSALAMHTPPRDNGVILVKAALKITIDMCKTESPTNIEKLR